MFNFYVGIKFGIFYLVFVCLWFGDKGVYILVLVRVIVVVGWFGINMWIGMEVIDILLSVLFLFWNSLVGYIVIVFVFFWFLNVGVVYKGL